MPFINIEIIIMSISGDLLCEHVRPVFFKYVGWLSVGSRHDKCSV